MMAAQTFQRFDTRFGGRAEAQASADAASSTSVIGGNRSSRNTMMSARFTSAAGSTWSGGCTSGTLSQ
jgi:hypothetical protein